MSKSFSIHVINIIREFSKETLLTKQNYLRLYLVKAISIFNTAKSDTFLMHNKSQLK